MKTCLLTGSFDPFTIGHYKIVLRACADFDFVYIKIGKNIFKKDRLYDLEKMKDGINYILEKNNITNARCIGTNKLSALSPLWAKKLNCCCIVRGIRNENDLKFEEKLAKFNLMLGQNTMFYINDDTYSSTKYKSLKNIGGNAEKLLPEGIKEYLVEK